MKTYIFKKSAFVLSMMILVAAMTSSCKKDNEDVNVYGSKLSVTNGVSNSQPQDVNQDGQPVPNTPPVQPGETAIIDVKAGSSNISLTNTGTNTVNASLNVNLDVNSSNSCFLFKDGVNIKLLALKDDTTPASGASKVRFINLGATTNNLLNISVGVGPTNVVSNLGIGQASEFITVTTGLNVNITILGINVGVAIPAANLEVGKNYNAWIDSANKVHLIKCN